MAAETHAKSSNNSSSDDSSSDNPSHSFAVPIDSPAYLLAERSSWHLLEKQAVDVIILDLRGRSDVCDFFVLATGQSDVHVQALAKHGQDVLLTAGHKVRGVEGAREGRWALLDFFDVVVHIFHAQAREYFQLERLWGDAPRLDLEPDWFAAPDVARRHPDLKFITAAPGGSD